MGGETIARIGAVVLAAGSGTRMRSERHKVLHRVAGQTMIWHVLRAVRDGGIDPAATVIVVGDQATEVAAVVDHDHLNAGYRFALQTERRGTGHATLVARDLVDPRVATVVVAYGDTPLLQAATVSRLIQTHREANAAVTLVTGIMADPTGYGRIVRDAKTGAVRAIVEERDATPEIKAIPEVNSGFCAFTAPWLWEALATIGPAPNGEIYLTALADVAAQECRPIATLRLDDVFETVGVNTRWQLAEAETAMRLRLVRALCDAGVTCIDPATTYIDPGVTVGVDTVIHPQTHLRGATRVGANCVVGPHTILTDAILDDGVTIFGSHATSVHLSGDKPFGPFADLR